MKLPPLSTDEFPAFFARVNGYTPFRWQNRLACEIMFGETWPRYISLPTAAGKTSLIDIATFALACQAHLRPSERTAALRMFFVVDRRVVVDAAYLHAKWLADTLETAQADNQADDILYSAAQRLQYLAGAGNPPLCASIMRGGMLLDTSWTRSATQPTVCVSTVDQLGSRLLFRGYGVSRNQRPIHASLVGCDSLIIIDEAHLSKPFCETLASVKRYSRKVEKPMAKTVTVVEMTATPLNEEDSFRLEPQDFPEPMLERRLEKPKPTKLEVIAVDGNKSSQDAFVDKMCQLAEPFKNGAPKVIGVVVNRVNTARQIFDKLDVPADDKALLIGRVRPLDRDRLWAVWERRITSDPKKRNVGNRPAFVVATQTIEVGADIDFDVLITEVAPIDALRQRFGRLNRRGDRNHCEAFIVATKEQLGARYEDPVYGVTLAPTWKWLNDHLEGKGKSKFINFAVANISRRLDATPIEKRTALSVQPPHAPVLLAAHLDSWVQTSSPPSPDADVAVFLHGPEAPEPEVHVVWRLDLDGFPDKKSERDQDKAMEAWPRVIEAAPPSSLEAITLPLRTVVRWLLQQRAPGTLTDLVVEKGLVSEREREQEKEVIMRPAVVWRGARGCNLAKRPADIRPGDTLIVPSTYGGADEFGWIGTRPAPAPVPDLAEAAAKGRGKVRFFRFHAKVLEAHGLTGFEERIFSFASDETSDIVRDLLPDLAEAANAPGVSPTLRETIAHFRSYPPRSIRVLRPASSYAGLVLRAPTDLRRSTFLELDEELDEPSQTREVLLTDHLTGTAETAKRLAQALEVGDTLVNDYTLVGKLHDLGKADPRFQVILYGQETSAYAAIAEGRLLAKSGRHFDTRTEAKRLHQLARYPDGARHETLSVVLSRAENVQLAAAHDPDLVLHLIASHHGWARPFLPMVQEAEEEHEEVDLRPLGLTFCGVAGYGGAELAFECAERFWKLVRRYGYWGLAWLETIFRLSDYEESANEVLEMQTQ